MTYTELMKEEVNTILRELRRGVTPELVRRVERFVIETDALRNIDSDDPRKHAYASLALALDAYVAFPGKAYSLEELETIARDLPSA